MDNNFWKKIKKPILVLAPMAGFTNSSFRQICKQFGADVVYSEMASTAALYYNQENKINRTVELLKFNRKKEQYYVVQLFGAKPEQFAEAAQFITKTVKPDGLDINFGCPVNKVLKQGAGAELMKDLDKSYQIIKAVIDNTNLPVSVKIRAKSGKVSAIDFVKKIADLKVAAIMIHGRTLSEGFVGEPDWQMIKEIKKYFSGIVIANGGINSLADAQKALKESEADGLGLARGILGRPWLFSEIREGKEKKLDRKKIFKIVISQAKQIEKEFGSVGIIELRKHLCWYVQGLEGASHLRKELVQVTSVKEIKNILKEK